MYLQAFNLLCRFEVLQALHVQQPWHFAFFNLHFAHFHVNVSIVRRHLWFIHVHLEFFSGLMYIAS